MRNIDMYSILLLPIIYILITFNIGISYVNCVGSMNPADSVFDGIQLLHQTNMIQRRIEKKGYDCICPDVKRPVCGYGKSGAIAKYASICQVKCEASRDKNFSFDVIAGSSCTADLESRSLTSANNRFNLNSLDNYNYTNDWLEYIRNETELNWIVDKTLKELLDVSGNAVDSKLACVCPGIRRPVCTFTTNGEVTEYTNLCVVKCQAARDPNFRFTVSIKTFCNRGLSSIVDLTAQWVANINHTFYTEKWIQLVEEETKFYKKINNAMKGLLGIQYIQFNN